MTERTLKNVEILEKKNLYKKFFEVDEYLMRYPQYNGKMSNPVRCEVMDRGHAVGILLFDPVRDKVALVEQFRCGVCLNGDYPWVLEIVAGMIDHENETPQEVALREAEEEAGASVTAIEPITRYYSSPGGITETLQLFCGRVDVSTLPAYAGLDEEDEDIRIVVMDVAEAEKLVADGTINNGLTIIALQWLMLNKAALLKKWGVK